MTDISVKYMGMTLSSPFIAASSGYTSKIEDILALERAGVGAIVLKSLFEEQIDNEALFLEKESKAHPENADFLYFYLKENSISNYLELIRQAKLQVKIPIIASINCYSKGNWLSFAKEIEIAGADGLEINIYSLPVELGKNSNEIEMSEIDIVASITQTVSIPIAVKIGENYTNINDFVDSLIICQARGVVFFNRFFRPDINLSRMSIVPSYPFSLKGEYTRELRWIAIVSSQKKKIDISASSGVLEPDDAIKLMLAGATTVQLCSVLYKHGMQVVKMFNTSLKSFMERKGFENTVDFIGKLNYANIKHPEKYERMQFILMREDI